VPRPRFPLEAVLKLRRQREEERQIAFALAAQRVESERDALGQLAARREEILRRMAAEQLAGVLDLASLARYPAYLNALAARIAEQSDAVQRAEALCLAAQQSLAEATRAVKTVEKLKESWLEGVRVEELRAAGKVLDEVALARFHRNDQPTEMAER
jgi:flagellar export protein FliJ